MTGSSSLSSEVPAKVHFLQAKPRIGSCKNPVNYAAAQVVFHKDDIPESRRARKLEVREWASSQILSIKRKPWTKETMTGLHPLCERRQAENQKGDRSKPYVFNFRAETLDFARTAPPIDRPSKFKLSRQLDTEVARLQELHSSDPVQRGQFKRTQEMPTHPKLVDALAWDPRTVLPAAEQAVNLARMTARSRAATAKVNGSLGLTREYMSPESQVCSINETVRSQKRDGTFSRSEQLASHTKHEQEVPLAVYRRSLRNRQALEPSRKYSTYAHSGTWELNATEGRYMWSDTGSFDFNSRGDVKRSVDPDRYNLEGPVQPAMPRPRLVLSRTAAREADKSGGGSS